MIRQEAFLDANQTCQAKIKTKAFNPDTIHWVGDHPTQTWFEKVHVIGWDFDTQGDSGAKLCWVAVCNFDQKGDLDDFTLTNRTCSAQVDDVN
jgi:hypothetical protein